MSETASPIFILGLTQRTGTNFLLDLLALHPACSPSPDPIREDWMVKHSDLLVRYASALSARWRQWGTDDLREPLLSQLGSALVQYLTSGVEPGQRLLTKTPTIANVQNFFLLFPGAPLVVIVRDGRAVAESLVRTFGGTYESRIREWAEAASELLGLLEDIDASQARLHIVRYEDLVASRQQEITALLRFLELDVSTYDFQAAEKLPIRGSSDTAISERGAHWEPVRPYSGFDPLRRWEGWPEGRHSRFNWIAGDCMEALGYETVAVGRSHGPLTHRALDLVHLLNKIPNRLLGRLRRSQGAAGVPAA